MEISVTLELRSGDGFSQLNCIHGVRPATPGSPRLSFPEAAVNRHALALVAAFVLAAAATHIAHAYELVQNGGFETASLSGWQPFNQGSSGGTGSWYAKSSGNGTYSGLPISAPPAGSWEAVADNSGRVAAILYQDLAIPATTRATLSFTIWLGNAAPGGTYTNGTSLSPTITNQRVRVDLINPATGLLVTSGALALLYQTASGTPTVVNPMVVTTDVTALAGQTVRLRFALVATQGGLIAGVDQVKLDVSPFSIHPAPITGLYYSDVHWGDFNGDGQMEIAMAGQTDPFTRSGWIERYTGGAWQAMATLPPTDYSGIALGDVDGNGTLDVGLQGVMNGPVLQVGVMHGDGTGGFSTSYDPIGAMGGSIAWGDFDEDGDLDALLTGEYNLVPTTYIGRNDGSGHLTFVDAGLPGSYLGNAVWADVTRFGIKDVALTGAAAVRYFDGNGAGTFGDVSTGLVDVDNGRVTVGDMNRDGYDDLVVVGSRPGNLATTKVFSRSGLSWSESMTGLDPVVDAAVTVGDFDNDGWMDVATCGSPGNGAYTRVYHNNGNGTFTDINASLPGVTLGAIAFGDFDGDGDLDLFVQGTDAAGPRSYVAINSTSTVNAAPTPPGMLQSELGDSEFWLEAGLFGGDDHTYPLELTHNFRAGTSSGAVDLIAPASNLVTGRRLVAEPGQAGLATLQRLSIDRIGHNEDVWWDVQSVDQSYLGSPWAGQQRLVLGPVIQSITDIPNDQGGHVRITVQKSVFDDPSRATYQAIGYNVWRLVPPGSMATTIAREGVAVDARTASARLAAADQTADARVAGTRRALQLLRGVPDLSLVEWNGRLFTRSPGRTVANPFGPGTWEIVGSFFAFQQASYVFATETLADSGATGANNQTFMVTMHTTTPSVWFASLSAIGRSVDNIAPGPPTGLSAAYHTGTGNHLTWQAAPETDFESFRIYRGTSPGFTASPATLVASTPNASWADPNYDSAVVYYKVSTTDHAGNESAAVAPGSTSAVDPAGPALAFALQTPSPNPFGEATTISFTLPRGVHARLEVFDASGRSVRTLVNGWQGPGQHVMQWLGDDAAGQRIKAGVYFCRLVAGEFHATRRVARMP